MNQPGKTKLVIIDSGGANINSVRFAFERLGCQPQFTDDWQTIKQATHVILPGVGAAAAAMNRLRESGLDQKISQLTQPVLGICLGMQVAVIEFARNMAGLSDAHSSEFKP